MQWLNNNQRYGLIAIGLHWLVAVTVIGLFILGLWMTSLTLYHPWYHRAHAGVDIDRANQIVRGIAQLAPPTWGPRVL